MKVHNIMEEQIIKHVNDLYDQLKGKNAPWLTCDCEHCRLDTTSYVLNRVPPKYVVSGRGVTHNASIDDRQLRADIDALIFEGMRAVSSAIRPYHTMANKTSVQTVDNPAFNFPTFIGSVYDGVTFEPLSGAKVVLKMDNEIAKMVDYTWQNPNITTSLTKGVFSFWVSPISAKVANENRVFNFTIEVSADGFEPILFDFTVPLVSEKQPATGLNSTYSLKVQDFFLFPK